MVSALPRRNKWTASFFAFARFPVPAPAGGRWVLPALPPRIIGPGKSTHCFDNKVPSSYCLGQWKGDVHPGLKESPTASAPSGGWLGNAESQAPIPDGPSQNPRGSRIPGHASNWEACWARKHLTEPPGGLPNCTPQDATYPTPFLIQGRRAARRAGISLRFKVRLAVPDPALRTTPLQLYGGLDRAQRGLERHSF